MRSLACEDRYIPGLKTLYNRYLENLKAGHINQNPHDRKWLFQRWLFDRKFEYFLKRQISYSDMQFINGYSRLQTICTPGGSNCFVFVNGDYYPCARLPDCDEFKIGDVWHGIDINKSYSLKKRYVELCKDDCERCWCANCCHLDCCSNVRDGRKITPDAKRKACEQYRKDTHQMLTDLFEVLESNPHALDYLKNSN
jgi:radical SAM protein with 4Fe4S-binding SPASM domain